MDWKTIKLSSGDKLFKIHHFTLIHSGHNYLLEVDEYQDGRFAGYGEHTTDKNFYIESVSGKSIDSCLSELIKKIASRSPN